MPSLLLFTSLLLFVDFLRDCLYDTGMTFIPEWVSFQSLPPPQVLRFSHRGERETRVTADEAQGAMGKRKMRGENFIERARLGARQFQSEVSTVSHDRIERPSLSCVVFCAKREFHLEWKTKWLVRERNVVSIFVLVPRGRDPFGQRPSWYRNEISFPSEHHSGAKLIPVWCEQPLRRTVPVPKVSVLERVDCVFLLMTYNTHCRHQYQWNKQTNKNPQESEWAPKEPETVRRLFKPYESGRSGRLCMPSYVNRNGNWTLNTNCTVQLTVITNRLR